MGAQREGKCKAKSIERNMVHGKKGDQPKGRWGRVGGAWRRCCEGKGTESHSGPVVG